MQQWKVIWIQSMLKEFGVPQVKAQSLWYDNLSATYLSAKPVSHANAKQTEIAFHFVEKELPTYNWRFSLFTLNIRLELALPNQCPQNT